MVKKIPLTQGKCALVDDEDYGYLMQWKWHAQKHRLTYYAIRTSLRGEEGWTNGYKRKTVRMHRIILERKIGRKLSATELCDHIDGDGLNVTRNNLRIADFRLNAQNRHDKLSSKYPGVSFRKSTGKFQAKIQVGEKHKGLGVFETEEEAYEAYCKACKIVESGDKNAIKDLLAPKKFSSKYKNIFWSKTKQKWESYFTLNKKRYWVGNFDNEEDAYEALIQKKREHNVPL